MRPDRPATILVIDDNPTNLLMATDHLARYAYTVLTAKDGERGLRRARYTQPDLILLDIGLPDIDGLEVCRRLKAQPDTREIPVLFMTAYTDLDNKQRAFELGGVDYVTKPFEAPELLARVRTHLTLVEQRRQLTQRAEEFKDRETAAAERYRQESARLEAALAERERLAAQVVLQAAQLQRLSQRWIEEQATQRHYLGMGVLERLRLVIGELDLVIAQLPEGLAASGLSRALALLRPLLPETGSDTAAASEELISENPLLYLSAREEQVFRLLVDGLGNKEIAAALDLKATTVGTYRARIIEKLGVDDVPGLVRLSLRFPRER